MSTSTASTPPTPTQANLAALLATFRARRDAALARRHDELAVFWAHQCVALVRTLDPPALANESFTLATAILHLNQPLRASSIVYPFIASSLACRVLYVHANLLAGCADDLIGDLTDPDTYQELTVVVDPVPVLPGEVDRVARMMTMRGGLHIRRMELKAAKTCLVSAINRDPGAWDAVRALIEFKLLTPDEERTLIDRPGLDVSGMVVGLGNESLASSASSSARPTRRGASAAAAESNRQVVAHAMKCLLHAHIAGTPPGTLSPTPTLFTSALNQSITHLDLSYHLTYSPTTHLAHGTAQLHAPPSKSSHLPAADAHSTFQMLTHSLDPNSATAFIAQIDTYLALRDVRALHAVATASIANDTSAAPLLHLMSPDDKYHRHADAIDAALNALTSAGVAPPTSALPGTATVHVYVLACYAIAAFHFAAAQVASDIYTPAPLALDALERVAPSRAATPWMAYMPALRALDAAFAFDEAFAPGVVMYAQVCSHLALALAAARGGPLDDATELGTVSELMCAVDKGRAYVHNAVEPVWALARMSRVMGEVAAARRYYREVEDRLAAQGRAGGVDEARVKGEVGGLLAENHQLSEGLQMLQDAVTRLRGKAHASVRVSLITSLVHAIVAMVSQFDDPTTVTATTELGKAHVHLLDALASTPPVHRFHLYVLQARICDLLRDARGALRAYQAALALKPGDPDLTRKMHVAAALNVDALAERVVKRVREAERKEEGDEGEEDELIPRPARAVSRKWVDLQDVEMRDDVDDDDDMDQDDFVGDADKHRAGHAGSRALAAGLRLDGHVREADHAPPRWIVLHDNKPAASAAAEPAKFTAADLDEPTEVLPFAAAPPDRARVNAPPARQRATRSAAVPQPPGGGGAGRGRNLMSLFERAADRRVDTLDATGTGTVTATATTTATATGAYPTDSGVGGLGGGGRSRARQLLDEEAEGESESATDADSSMDHNSPTVRVAAAVAAAAAAAAGTGGPTTRAAARRAQGQGQGQAGSSSAAGATVDDSQVVASPTAAVAAARGSRNHRGGGRGGGGLARSGRNGGR